MSDAEETRESPYLLAQELPPKVVDIMLAGGVTAAPMLVAGVLFMLFKDAPTYIVWALAGVGYGTGVLAAVTLFGFVNILLHLGFSAGESGGETA